MIEKSIVHLKDGANMNSILIETNFSLLKIHPNSKTITRFCTRYRIRRPYTWITRGDIIHSTNISKSMVHIDECNIGGEIHICKIRSEEHTSELQSQFHLV